MSAAAAEAARAALARAGVHTPISDEELASLAERASSASRGRGGGGGADADDEDGVEEDEGEEEEEEESVRA